MGTTAFLTERSWVDDDGYHCWTAHDCTDGRVTTMLPYPRWHRVGDQIEPSISCDACGAHYWGKLTRTEDDFRSNAAHGIYDDPLDPTVP